MKPLQSVLEGHQDDFDQMKHYLDPFQFTLGGNWDYKSGSFDRALDDERIVWLRLPFVVTRGQIEGEDRRHDGVRVQMGTPYVLKHVYETGLDHDAVPRTVGAMFDQFQDPADPDDEVEERWVREAMKLLTRIERDL